MDFFDLPSESKLYTQKNVLQVVCSRRAFFPLFLFPGQNVSCHHCDGFCCIDVCFPIRLPTFLPNGIYFERIMFNLSFCSLLSSTNPLSPSLSLPLSLSLSLSFSLILSLSSSRFVVCNFFLSVPRALVDGIAGGVNLRLPAHLMLAPVRFFMRHDVLSDD